MTGASSVNTIVWLYHTSTDSSHLPTTPLLHLLYPTTQRGCGSQSKQQEHTSSPCSGWEVRSLPVDSEDDEMDSVCSGDLCAEVSTGEEGWEMG